MDKNTSPLLIAALSFDLEVNSQGYTKVLPFGQFKAVDGRPTDVPFWFTDNESGKALATALNALQTDIVVDYEHQTINTEKNGQPAPASGWIKPVNFVWQDNEGLRAKIDWTSRAAAHIENKEYKYLSPVFSYDKTGKVKQFLHLALTNNPALDNLGELTAALSKQFNSTKTEQKPMNKELHALVCAALALSDNASEEQIQTALTQVIDKMTDGKGLAACDMSLPKYIDGKQIVTLSASQIKPDPAKFVPIEMMSEMQNQIAALTQKQAETEKQEANNLIEVALKDGRLLPGQKDWATSLAASNFAALTSFLDSTKPIAALSQTQTNGTPPVSTGSQTLNAEELAVCSQMGISHEDFLKTKGNK